MKNPYAAPKSKTEVASGLSFEFELRNRKIIASGSYLSGVEKVFVEGVPVSRKRNFNRRSKHFVEIEGINHIIEFRVKSIFTANIECVVYENNYLVAHYKLKRSINILVLAAYAMFVMAIGLLGYLKKKLNLPNEIDYFVIGSIPFAIAFVIQGFRYKTVKIDNAHNN